MDAKLKAKWVKALRSGEFKQSLRRLYDGQGYCCLGVLGKCVGVPEKRLRTGGSYGTREVLAVLPSIKVRKQLAGMNDGEYQSRNWSFRSIAAWIEKNL